MKDELEFFGTNQKDVVLSIANKLIAKYNSLGYNLPVFNNWNEIGKSKHKSGIIHLIEKIDYTVLSKGDPLSVPKMLKRIAKDEQKHWGKPDGDPTAALEETYVGYGHFRYEGTNVCILTRDEIKAIKLYTNMSNIDFATTEFKYKNLTITARLVKSGAQFPNSKNDGLHNKYDVSVTNSDTDNRTSFDYYDSTHNYNNAITEVKGEDLLQAFECFISDAIAGDESFEDFCDNMGYDPDSRSAEKIWKECIKSRDKAKNVIDDDLYDFANELQNRIN